MNHEKTTLFIGHCGANGVFEALYYGKPMLGFPQMFEQKSVANKLTLLGVAQYMDPKTTTAAGLAKQIAEISHPSSKENKAVDWARRVIEYEESSGADVQYYAEYFSKFGSYHLQPAAHYHSFVA